MNSKCNSFIIMMPRKIYIVIVYWNVALYGSWMTSVEAWTAAAIVVKGIKQSQTSLARREPSYHHRERRFHGKSPTKVFGISEWRDLIFEYPVTQDDQSSAKQKEYGDCLPKEICVLPFPYQEVLLQGETKQLRLYEKRFIKLFDMCIQNHCNIVAMGMIAQSGIIQTVPIVEIEDYNRLVLNDELSIFVTIRVVGRAKLVDIIQSVPYIKALCIEMIDTVPPNLELPCLLASHIEASIVQLSSMEHRLEMAKQSGEVSMSLPATNTIEDKNTTTLVDPNDLDLVMQHRIRVAKLEDTYYDDTYDEEGDDDDDDDEEEKMQNMIDRRKRFRRAYDIALATDSQGYQVSAPTITTALNQQLDESNIIAATGGTVDRTVQELAAISWAAFCTEILPEIDAAVRIQALDCDDILDRLKLASGLMRQKKGLLRARMEKAGLSVSVDDESSASSSAKDDNDSKDDE